MKVAAAKYPLERLRDFSAFAEKQQAFLHEAKTAGAELAVLPEYLSLELAGLFALATEAGRLAYLSGLGPQRDTAEASYVAWQWPQSNVEHVLRIRVQKAYADATYSPRWKDFKARSRDEGEQLYAQMRARRVFA